MDDVVRQVLENKYGLRLRTRIGRGGFAGVYRAESAEGVLCAVKVSLDPLDGENAAVRKELDNFNLVKTVTGHSNIVSLMDWWLVAGYLVTRWELATDGSLLDLLHQHRDSGLEGIPLEELSRYLRDAARGIDFLNGEKCIDHRDIKPANLLLFHGCVKLADLGRAKWHGVVWFSKMSGTGLFGSFVVISPVSRAAIAHRRGNGQTVRWQGGPNGSRAVADNYEDLAVELIPVSRRQGAQ